MKWTWRSWTIRLLWPAAMPPRRFRASAAGAVKPPPAAPQPVVEDLDGAKVARSPVRGMVVKLAVHEGEAIQEGDTLVVLEAMKMESAVAAPIAGTVQEIRVKVGDKVENGQVLVVLA